MSHTAADELAEQIELYRKRRAEELRALAEVLVSADLLSDASPLYAAASMAAGPLKQTGDDSPDPGRVYWGYAIEDLSLTLDGQWKGIPRNSAFEASLLTIIVQEYVPDTVHQLDVGYNNLRRADVDFWMRGIHEPNADDICDIQCAWHLDTHLYSEPSSSVHPKHHFQFGGNRVDGVADQVRGIWMPDTPRVMTLPLDGVLAIDFVLAHYAGKAWMRLHEDSEYLDLRHMAARRYWCPVAESIVDFFGAAKQQAQNHSALKILPNLAWI
jgi:hypothetical protein